MSNYYVSGCIGDGYAVATCDDDVAQFWTLYHRNDKGLSEGIIDCVFREDAEAAMRVYEQRDALAAENASIKESVAMHAAGFKICPACSHQDECETDDIVWMVKETPATDAYLNSVRADAVVKAAAHLGDMASGKSASTAELIKSCGRVLLAFAAQLRAGEPS